ncbi:MAG: hypothetical protein CW691_05795 [Candidatus Bathyarchaeum sp.]|nr:MAG: hypothetical protein CW691_05795 [Candidatus Bathyarchaeum sp.]
MDNKKLKKMTELLNNKLKKLDSAPSNNSTLRRHPSELAEFRNVLEITSKTIPGQKIYFENMIEKAGFSTFYLSDALDVITHVLEIIEK